MSAPPAPDPRQALRVVSYNVRELADDRDAAVRVVRALQPDVLCLQEVPRRLTTEIVLPAFARSCGLWWSGGRRGSGGTAVLTSLRVRVHRRGVVRMPVRLPDRTRGAAAVVVSVPGSGATARPVTVASIHLGLREGERADHVEALLGRLHAPAVVAGDVNEGPDGPACARLDARLRRLTAADPTFPADHPTAAIDGVWGTGGVETVAAASPAPGPSPDDLVAGSDHLPVWVDVRVL
jgi:endonuclease/exonuclease/phosphatase family metal-dependent hydrolase